MLIAYDKDLNGNMHVLNMHVLLLECLNLVA